MDGLILIVGLIIWFASSLKKKNQKDQERIRQIKARSARRMQEAAEKKQTKTFQTISVDEGKPHFTKGTEGGSMSLPLSAEAAFRGSLEAESLEGECICAPELGHSRDETVPGRESVFTDEIAQDGLVDFSARSLMQAVVMNEILTRPQQRMRRY